MLSEMSNHSIEQDENLAKQFSKTPGTPIKSLNQTPRKSNRKRSLFQCGSPSNSEDLGPMSPLSLSSNCSYESQQSPSFSPNGKFTTPPKTPVHQGEGRFSARKMEIKSSLFPNLNVHTPKSHGSPSTPKRRSQRITPRKLNVSDDDILRELTTPPKSSKKRRESNRNCRVDEDEIDSSQSICISTPRRRKGNGESTPMSKLGIKTISSENFYGPVPQPPKARTQLFIDSLGSKVENRKRARSPSLDSNTSNRSFVSGSGPKKTKKSVDNRLRNSRHGRHKGPHIGVWHGVKKPKKMKLVKNCNKFLLSPKSRIMKMLETKTPNTTSVKAKSMTVGKPRKRIAHRVKRVPELFDDGLIDPFPHSLIKRKKLPSAAHPSNAFHVKEEPAVPDPNKKFMKYGMRRTATFTLNDNLKLQFSDGVMKMQSPKKRRKLYSKTNEVIYDFCDYEEKNNDLKENIDNILAKLHNDKDIPSHQKTQLPSPCKVEVQRLGESELSSAIGSPRKSLKPVSLTPRKVLSSLESDAGNKLITNLSSLAINEVNSGAVGSGDKCHSQSFTQKISNKNNVSLEKTGSLVSIARNVLSDSDETGDAFPLSPENVDNQEVENSKSEERFFSLFYKQNWNNSPSSKECGGSRYSAKKKCIKVPDDQYLLDAGQKSIGIVTCPKCGVMYQSGDFADEATHKNFHDHLPELRFTGWTNERVVGRYGDGRVVMIVNADPKSWWHKVQKIVDIVDQELGFPEGSVNALFYKTVYLYINDKSKQIVGCLIAEECKKGYKMYPPLEGVEVDSCSKDPSPCKIGISRIWTALNHRRRGVATKMIECLQKTFVFGELVPLDLIAFSVPSPSGKALAQKVTGKLDFLVYGFI